MAAPVSTRTVRRIPTEDIAVNRLQSEGFVCRRISAGGQQYLLAVRGIPLPLSLDAQYLGRFLRDHATDPESSFRLYAHRGNRLTIISPPGRVSQIGQGIQDGTLSFSQRVPAHDIVPAHVIASERRWRYTYSLEELEAVFRAWPKVIFRGSEAWEYFRKVLGDINEIMTGSRAPVGVGREYPLLQDALRAVGFTAFTTLAGPDGHRFMVAMKEPGLLNPQGVAEFIRRNAGNRRLLRVYDMSSDLSLTELTDAEAIRRIGTALGDRARTRRSGNR